MLWRWPHDFLNLHELPPAIPSLHTCLSACSGTLQSCLSFRRLHKAARLRLLCIAGKQNVSLLEAYKLEYYALNPKPQRHKAAKNGKPDPKILIPTTLIPPPPPNSPKPKTAPNSLSRSQHPHYFRGLPFGVFKGYLGDIEASIIRKKSRIPQAPSSGI